MRAEVLRELEDRETRAAVREAERIVTAKPPRVPEWRKRLQAQDRTGEIRHNG